MSTIKYGDVTLKLTRVNSFAQEPVYSDDGIDYLYTRFVLDVTGLLTLDSPIVGSGATLASNIAVVQSNLMTPRSTLLFTINGESVLTASAPDAKAGPFPRSCTITNITGTRSAVINYVVEAHVKVTCSESSENPVLSNRWSMENVYDENLYCTRRTTGRLTVKAVDGGINADSFRAYGIPPLPRGWKRKRFSFNVDTTGLILDYTVEDEEKFLLPPIHSTTATGTYREATEKFGTYTIVDVSVTCAGAKSISKTDLISDCAQVCLSRLDLGVAVGKDRLLRAELSEELFDNRVTMSLTARRILNVITANVLISSNKIGKAIGTEGLAAMDLGFRESELIKSAVAAWKPTCAEPTGVGPFTLDDQSQSTNEEIEDPEVYISLGDNFAGESPAYNGDHYQYLFTDYELEIEYDTDEHKIQLPVAGTGPLASEIIQLAAPTQRATIRWKGDRIGTWPKAPIAHSLVTNGHLLSKKVRPEAPRLIPDGQQYEYSMSGEYIYAITTPLNEATSGLPAPSMPYDTLSPSDARVPSSTFTGDIVF